MSIERSPRSVRMATARLATAAASKNSSFTHRAIEEVPCNHASTASAASATAPAPNNAPSSCPCCSSGTNAMAPNKTSSSIDNWTIAAGAFINHASHACSRCSVRHAAPPPVLSEIWSTTSAASVLRWKNNWYSDESARRPPVPRRDKSAQYISKTSTARVRAPSGRGADRQSREPRRRRRDRFRSRAGSQQAGTFNGTGCEFAGKDGGKIIERKEKARTHNRRTVTPGYAVVNAARDAYSSLDLITKARRTRRNTKKNERRR